MLVNHKPTAQQISDALYMLRNLAVGDDEQTRIEDRGYWEDVPYLVGATIQAQLALGDYNGAIRTFARYHLDSFSWREIEPMAKDWSDDFTVGAEEPALASEQLCEEIESAWVQVTAF